MRRSDAAPWAWAVWLVTLITLLAYGAWRIWSTHDAAKSQLEALEPRIARLAGLGEHRDRLQLNLSQLTQALDRHVYPASRDSSQAGNDAQQRVREVFTKAGLEVISIQLLPAKASTQFERIPVALRLEGELPALQAALAALPSLAPTLFVEGMSVQGPGPRQTDRPLRVVAQFDLFVLRIRS